MRLLLLSISALFLNISLASASGDKKILLNTSYEGLEITSKGETRMGISNGIPSFTLTEIKEGKDVYSRIILDGYTKDYALTGQPELPLMGRLIEIPYGAQVKVNIISFREEIIDLKGRGVNHPLYPTQPSYSKSADPSEIKFVMDPASYSQDRYNERETVTVEYLGTMRGVRIARLSIAPFRYNPVSRTLKVINDLQVEIIFENADLATTKSQRARFYSPYFENTFNSIINHKPYGGSKDTLMKYPVKYVIVSDRAFSQALQPFIQWKTKKGFKVIEAYTDMAAVGTTTTSIKAYLAALYNAATPSDPAPSFVLFAGDVAQIPAFNGTTGTHVTDLYYCEYDGNGDYFPDVYYGRFSANNLTQLQPQIDKTLMYEQYLMTDPSFLNEVVMVAGVDASYAPIHGNGQINYGTNYYFNTAHGLTSYNYLYPASGNSASQVIANISGGVGFANYTAHCGTNGWSDPSFTTSNISSLQNNGQYPLMIGNCCQSNSFNGTCFGEELLRASNKGAMGYIGGSNNTLWDEDFYWSVGAKTPAVNPVYSSTALGAYDRLFHEHGEPRSEWYYTNGQVNVAGNLSVTQSNSSSIHYYWEIYHLMGDPSVMTWFSVPPALTVNHPPLLPLGSTSLTVYTEPDAYVGISKDSILYGAALADTNGMAIINLNLITVPGNADIVVTRQNRQPYSGTIVVASPANAYLALNEQLIHDSTGNNNNKADFGESITVDVAITNYGNSPAGMVSAILSTPDASVIITDSIAQFSLVPSHDTIALSGAFSFDVKPVINDQHKVKFTLSMSDTSNGSWNSDFFVTLNAPKLVIGDFVIIDSVTGNGNGAIDPGETVELRIKVQNAGHSDAANTQSLLVTYSPIALIPNGQVNLGNLQALSSAYTSFQAVISATAIPGDVFEVHNTLTSGLYSDTTYFAPMVGLLSEDWEGGSFNKFNWMHGGNLSWTISNQGAYQGNFCAKSGSIANSEISTFYITMTALGNDTISFYRKVSSELDYDFLEFYIDNNLADKWSGEVIWGKVSFPVSPGQHTFKWVYSKDWYVVSGSDCAWIDNIEFPVAAGIATGQPDKSPPALNCTIYPNPSTGQAEFTFSIPEQGNVKIQLYNALGSLNETITDQAYTAGTHRIAFDGRNLVPGVYITVISVDNHKITQKLVISR